MVLGWVPGTFEMLLVAGVALLLFGHRLPSVMRSLGRGVVEFKKGVQGVDEEENDAVSNESMSSRESSAQKS